MASIQERRTTPPVFRDATELHEGRLSQAAFEIPGTEARWLAANAVHRSCAAFEILRTGPRLLAAVAVGS